MYFPVINCFLYMSVGYKSFSANADQNTSCCKRFRKAYIPAGQVLGNVVVCDRFEYKSDLVADTL